MLIPLLALLFQPAASTGGGYGAPATGYGGQPQVLDTLLSNITFTAPEESYGAPAPSYGSPHYSRSVGMIDIGFWPEK